MFFNEKRYRSINTGSTNKNTINITPLRVCSISELRCLCRNLIFGTKRDTKVVNDTQQSIVIVLQTLAAALCTACGIILPL